MIHVLSPGDPTQRTGGYLYNAHLVRGLRERGHSVVVHALEGRWPTVADPAALGRRIEALPPGRILADGLLWTAVADHVARPVGVLVHSPLWRELGRDWKAPEQAALGRAALVITTSALTARDLDLKQAHVVEPGTAPPPPRPRSSGLPYALISVATVTPRKGHDVLLEALDQLQAPYELRVYGSLTRDAGWADTLQRRSPAAVHWMGEVRGDALQEAYAQADALVHPARYEAWGMALAEGLARGLPVVTTPAGVLEGRGGALVVPPEDPTALAAALQSLLTDSTVGDRTLRSGCGPVTAHLDRPDRSIRTPVGPDGGRVTFSASWLAQREPFDHAARSSALAQALADHLSGRSDTHVVELAGGTGSGIRYLRRWLPEARWTLADHDVALLDTIPEDLASPIRHDLRTVRTLPVPAPSAVTCQALLDLVDLGFLVDLADWLTHDLGRTPLLAALTVDGRVRWTPHDPLDDDVQAAFRLHQLGDRGFGGSVGPFATPILADLLTVRGYVVHRERADWQVGDAAMLRAMVEGTAEAATEIHPQPAAVHAWGARRLALIDEGALSLTVGHEDLLALPR